MIFKNFLPFHPIVRRHQLPKVRCEQNLTSFRLKIQGVEQVSTSIRCWFSKREQLLESPKKKLRMKKKQKDAGLTVLDRLRLSSHSQALSHYCSTRRLLAAEFPPWPGSPLLSQPGYVGLPQRTHVDAELSADARSTWGTQPQDPRPQAILYTRPPSSWITGAHHNSQPIALELFLLLKCNIPLITLPFSGFYHVKPH